jgi:hypothetical protein
LSARCSSGAYPAYCCFQWPVQCWPPGAFASTDYRLLVSSGRCPPMVLRPLDLRIAPRPPRSGSVSVYAERSKGHRKSRRSGSRTRSLHDHTSLRGVSVPMPGSSARRLPRSPSALTRLPSLSALRRVASDGSMERPLASCWPHTGARVVCGAVKLMPIYPGFRLTRGTGPGSQRVRPSGG